MLQKIEDLETASDEAAPAEVPRLPPQTIKKYVPSPVNAEV